MTRWFLPLIAVLALAGCNGASSTKAATPKYKTLVKTDVEEGKGKPIDEGDVVMVQYKGTLTNGTVFDQNMDESKPPFVFAVGAGSVIKGWDEGVIGMKPGGVRELKIPSDLAYGPKGNGETIPPNSDLDFTVKLLGAFSPGEDDFFSREDLKVGTGTPAAKGDTITIKYVGKALNGYVFDDTHAEEPVTGVMDASEGGFIVGLVAGMEGMKPGGKRRITMGPALAMGPMNQRMANQILIYEVDMIAVKK